MKGFAIILPMALACLGAISLAMGQPTGAKSGAAPSERMLVVCQALTTYIAKVDAARSISDKEKREAKYTEAKNELSSALNQSEQAELLGEASSYARYTETIATADPGKPDMADDLEKRLKSRSALLERCESYTKSR